MFTALCVQNVVHAFSSDETSPDTRNHSPILTKIKRNFYPVCNISMFKRYFLCIMRAERSVRAFQPRNRPRHTQIGNHSPILTKIKRNFYPVCNISMFKRYFLCIMRAERSALVFQRRNKPTHTQITVIR